MNNSFEQIISSLERLKSMQGKGQTELLQEVLKGKSGMENIQDILLNNGNQTSMLMNLLNKNGTGNFPSGFSDIIAKVATQQTEKVNTIPNETKEMALKNYGLSPIVGFADKNIVYAIAKLLS